MGNLNIKVNAVDFSVRKVRFLVVKLQRKREENNFIINLANRKSDSWNKTLIHSKCI